MDDLSCNGEVVAQTLRELNTINSRLGGNKISTEGLNLLLGEKNNQVFKIVDLGCGGGDMLQVFNKWAKKKNKQLHLTGIDANPFIIEYANKNVRQDANIQFETENVLTQTFLDRTFDVIHCSLFLHHFTDKELIHLLSNFKKQARIGVIINDLHRHWLAYYSIKILTSLFSRSSMVRYDAPLSVKRGFRKKELQELLYKAGIGDYHLKWKWAFRWQLVY